ncbi:hypothetical protein JG688_00003876 [Phytophthora aleatoria]|uniref:beta-glucosidase n=1 Tax=Phytophthora aleatoria TaxID=2496075 RepID=A0A8J5J2J3_9STRA|nr:hypothetical protein JG688_00003876 [Phytophthora aleatoria]
MVLAPRPCHATFTPAQVTGFYFRPCHDANDEIVSEYFRCRCGTVRKQSRRNGYSSLMQHVRREYPDYEVVMLTAYTAETGSLLNYVRRSALNVFGWLDWIIKTASRSTSARILLQEAGLESLTRIVERYIAAEMPEQVGLILDGWSHASEHFVAVFACYEVDGVMMTPLLCMAPLLNRRAGTMSSWLGCCPVTTLLEHLDPTDDAIVDVLPAPPYNKRLLSLLKDLKKVATADVYDAQAQAIVNGFSTAQLLGQMTQLTLRAVMNDTTRELNETTVRLFAKQHVGSYFNTFWDKPIDNRYSYNASEFRSIIQRIQEISMEENGGHPIIYGIDSVHGANYVDGSVLMPHQVNFGATFNPDLVYEAAHPYLASVMGAAVIRGLQSYNQTAVCMKHFIGYSKTPTGHDKDNVNIPDFDLLNYFIPSFKAALEAGAMTTMESYTSINGEPVIASSRMLDDLLRSDLEFNGVLVSDWGEIYNLHDFHRVSATREEAVATSLMQTSVDMSMVLADTDFIEYGLNMLKENPD